MWAWIGVFLDASFALTLPAGRGADGGQARGVRDDRRRRDRLASAPACSPIGSGARRSRSPRWRSAARCAATIGFLFGGDPAWLVALCIVWGISIVADSAQFSASIAELADRARVGHDADACRPRSGFTLTLVTIHLMPYLRRRARLALRVRAAGDRPGARRLGDGAAARASALGRAGRRPALTRRPRRRIRGMARRAARRRIFAAPAFACACRRLRIHRSHYGGNHGISPRRAPARSLQLPRALPLLDRRGPRLRHLRHHRRLALRQGDDRRRRRVRPDDRDDRARARQHPGGQLEGRRLSRRARDAGAGGGAARRLHRQEGRARSPISRSSSARSFRSRRCRSRSPCRAATARSSSATPATPSSSRTRAPSGATTTLADTVFSTVPGAPVFVGKAPSYRSKNAKLGIDLDIKGHNALQSTFVFQS